MLPCRFSWYSDYFRTPRAIFFKMSHGYCIDNEKLDKLVHPVVKTVPDWHLGKDSKVASEFRNTSVEQAEPPIPPPFFLCLFPWSCLDAYACVILSTRWNYRAVLYVTHAWLESGVLRRMKRDEEVLRWAANSPYGSGTDIVLTPSWKRGLRWHPIGYIPLMLSDILALRTQSFVNHRTPSPCPSRGELCLQRLWHPQGVDYLAKTMVMRFPPVIH